MSTPSLSLYQIDKELLELMQFREDLLSDPDITPQEQQASLQAVNQQITEYAGRQLATVDSVTAALRECETRVAVLKAEATRVAEIADTWQKRFDLIEGAAIRGMQALGTRKLEGPTSSLQLKKCPPSVDVAQPDLVPSHYQRVTVKMTADLKDRLLAFLMRNDTGATLFADLMACDASAPEPIKKKIAKELQAGVGVLGCRMITDRDRLETK